MCHTNQPRTIQFFLPNGDPSSIRIAEQTSSIVQLIEVARRDIDEFLKMPVAKQVGLYFLISGDNKDELYVGQSGNVGNRIIQHYKDEKKDWERVLIMVSLTNNLTATHVLYLESLSINKAKHCQRYVLINGNGGQKPNTPLPLKSDCDEIHKITSLLLSTLGYPIFESLIETSPTKDKQIFFCRRADVNAKGIYTNEGLVVLKGSSFPMTTKRKTEQRIYDNRDQLLAKKVIIKQGDRFIFQKDHLFSSPSGASSFLLQGSSNGWTDWKTEKGITLHDHQGRTLSIDH